MADEDRQCQRLLGRGGEHQYLGIGQLVKATFHEDELI